MEYDWEQFLGCLCRVLGSVELLGLEVVHLAGDLGWCECVGYVDEVLVRELCVEVEVHVLGECVVLSIVGVLDGLFVLYVGGVVEVEEVARVVAGDVLDDEVVVEYH